MVLERAQLAGKGTSFLKNGVAWGPWQAIGAMSLARYQITAEDGEAGSVNGSLWDWDEGSEREWDDWAEEWEAEKDEKERQQVALIRGAMMDQQQGIGSGSGIGTSASTPMPFMLEFERAPVGPPLTPVHPSVQGQQTTPVQQHPYPGQGVARNRSKSVITPTGPPVGLGITLPGALGTQSPLESSSPSSPSNGYGLGLGVRARSSTVSGSVPSTPGPSSETFSGMGDPIAAEKEKKGRPRLGRLKSGK